MFKPFPSIRHDQRGDSIVEVLIALAVIGSVLTGAFVATNRSTVAVRDSEEHAQALQLLQGQVEQLRSYVQQTKFSAVPNKFCFQPDGTLKITSTPDCPSSTVEPIYSFMIDRTNAAVVPPATMAFNVQVTWNAVTGNPAQESIMYKIAGAP